MPPLAPKQKFGGQLEQLWLRLDLVAQNVKLEFEMTRLSKKISDRQLKACNFGIEFHTMI